MSENTAKAACTQAEFNMARAAGLFIATTADERAIHAFAEAVGAKHQAFEARVLALLTELEDEGILTEGQCSEVWGGDRLDWRIASRPMPPAFGSEP